LLGQVMTMDNPHLIYSTLHLALRNLGLGRVINPASNIQA
jgi:phosphotransferase system enzyme I (PtsP)